MILNITSGPIRRTPLLDEAYPQDVSVDTVGTDATFQVVIAQPGKPDGYTYQWYYDGNPVEGAVGSSYTRPAEKGGHSVYCMVTSKAGSVLSRTATVTASTLWLYNLGDQCNAVTGGYTVRGLAMNNSDATLTQNPNVSYNSTNVYMYENERYGGAFHTVNKINLSGYNTLYFDGKMKYSGSSGSGIRCTLNIWSAFGSYTAQNRVAYIESNNADGLRSLNVANLNGEYYIGFHLFSGYHQGASEVTMRKLYLT